MLNLTSSLADMLIVCVCAQREWRRVQAKRNAAATAIQACWRGHVVRKQNGWMRRLLDRCTCAYEALAHDRWAHANLAGMHAALVALGLHLLEPYPMVTFDCSTTTLC